MPILEITSPIRSTLRAAAHPLRPVVLIGDKGLSDAVVQEIDRNLSSHGLIKVRAAGQERAEREELLYAICERLNCAPVHHLGKVFVLYRPTEADPEGSRLLAGARPAAAKRAATGPSTLGVQPRKQDAPHVPKKLAADGKPAPERVRVPREERRAPGPMSARERYLGAGKAPRPSLYDDGSPTFKPRRFFETPRTPRPGSTTGTGRAGVERANLSDEGETFGSRVATRPAARPARPASAPRPAPKGPRFGGDDRRSAPSEGGKPASTGSRAPRSGSAFSLRAGARDGSGPRGTFAGNRPGGDRAAAPGRKPSRFNKK